MTDRERVLRSLTWENPNSLVTESYVSAATWRTYRELLIPFAKRMPNDFSVYSGAPDYDKMPSGYGQDEVFEDAWGCIWYCRVAGMQGIISRHPLNWDGFKDFKTPDPMKTADLSPWDQREFENDLAIKIKHSKFVMCGGERLWERVHFLRGYENAMIDLADDEPNLRELIGMIAEYNIENAKKYLQYTEVDCIAFQDDWGEQNRLMISPVMWREYFYDGYRRMFQSVKAAGKYVYFHTDGYLLPVIDDLRRAGADIINLQSGCHKLGELYAACNRKVCVSVDIDRQSVMPYGTADEMKRHIRDIYDNLKGGEGGLWVKIDVYPDTPLSNIEAMCEILEELRAQS